MYAPSRGGIPPARYLLYTSSTLDLGFLTRVIRGFTDRCRRILLARTEMGKMTPMSGPPKAGEMHSPAPTLIVAKVSVPLYRAGLIRREELIRRLSDDVDRRVTLVVAPAGYGKTTTLMQWARADPVRRFGWVSLESSDDDPAGLWRYIVYALRALIPGFASAAWELLHQPQPDIEAVIASLLNDLLDVPGRLVVVLDDYQVITKQECHDSVQRFIDHLPLSMQIAFGSRARPALSMSKLEASGLTLTIDAEALKFTADETRTVLEHTGKRLGPDAVARVQERAEGWPVGVYLAARAESTPFGEGEGSGGTGAVHSYLREQILDQIPEQECVALARWSILQHLNGHLCDRVADQEGSAHKLTALSESNMLLTPLDANGEWYRFHDLLRDELQREFIQQPVAEQRATHLRAMDWWLENDGTPRAIHHAIEAKAYERAGELLCANWFEYMLSGSLETVRGWIGRFPDEAMRDYPPILVTSAWIAAFSGDVKGTHRFATAARESSFDSPMPDGTASYASSIEILRAALGLDGLKDANEHAELAYSLEPPGSPWKPLTAALVGITRFGLGRFEDARIALIEAAVTPTGPDGVAIYARGQLALLEMANGDWDEGRRHADLARADIDELNLKNLLSSAAAQVAAAAAAAHFGNGGLAIQLLGSLASLQKVLTDAIPFDAFLIHLVAAETYLVIGDYRAASVHARTAYNRLERLGDGGIFEQRLEETMRTLESGNEAASTSPVEPEPLTDRELQVLAMLESELSLRDIGAELFVSRNTAKTHVASVYRKLGVTTRSAAVARARQLDLI